MIKEIANEQPDDGYTTVFTNREQRVWCPLLDRDTYIERCRNHCVYYKGKYPQCKLKGANQ